MYGDFVGSIFPSHSNTIPAHYGQNTNWNCIIAVSPRAPGIHTPFQKVSSKWGMTRSLRRAIPGAKMVFYGPGVVLPVVF